MVLRLRKEIDKDDYALDGYDRKDELKGKIILYTCIVFGSDRSPRRDDASMIKRA